MERRWSGVTTQRLKDYLREHGIKQSWLARNIGIRDDRLSRMLSGRAQISTDMLEKICKALGTNPAELYK